MEVKLEHSFASMPPNIVVMFTIRFHILFVSRSMGERVAGRRREAFRWGFPQTPQIVLRECTKDHRGIKAGCLIQYQCHGIIRWGMDHFQELKQQLPSSAGSRTGEFIEGSAHASLTLEGKCTQHKAHTETHSWQKHCVVTSYLNITLKHCVETFKTSYCNFVLRHHFLS